MSAEHFVTVAYLGPAREWAGVAADKISLQTGSSLHSVIDRVAELRPKLAERRAMLRFAVNDTYAADDVALADGDRIGVIPPVSGGAPDDVVRLTESVISSDTIRPHLDAEGAAGGLTIFEGVTRFERCVEHGDLVRLSYEAYGEMACKQMRLLVERCRERWPIERCALVHRVGDVEIGEASVVIGVACGHRAEAFDACRFLIDELKREVPIWKKEVWSDGHTSWVDPTKRDPKEKSGG